MRDNTNVYKRNIAIELAGWYGTLAILSAYSFNTFGILSAHSYVYIFLNITGSSGLLADTYMKKDYQPVVLNCIWLLFGVISLIRLFL